jgi:hypothetical protein
MSTAAGWKRNTSAARAGRAALVSGRDGASYLALRSRWAAPRASCSGVSVL